ncbi:MAG: site-2 protease family protein [Thermoprotei archaeon]|nr:site-2 protease family protein [TACK group archaeon]
MIWIEAFAAATVAIWGYALAAKPKGVKMFFAVMMVSSASLNRVVDSLALRFRSLWRRLYALGTVIFLLSSLSALYLLSAGLVRDLSLRQQVETVTVLVPGLTVPLLPGLVAIAVTAAVHELSHAVAARSEGIKVNSLGILLFLAFPIGAFTEPDEESFRTARRMAKLKMLAAGTLANLITAALVLSVAAGLLLGYPTSPTSVMIERVLPGTLASSVGIRPGELLLALNGTTVNSTTSVSAFLSKSHPGQLINIATSGGSYVGRLGRGPNGAGFIGVGLSPYYIPRFPLGLSPGFWFQVTIYSFWIWFINLSVAVFNALPIPLLDGDQFFRELFQGLADASRSAKGGFASLAGGFWKAAIYVVEGGAIFLLLANLALSFRAMV